MTYFIFGFGRWMWTAFRRKDDRRWTTWWTRDPFGWTFNLSFIVWRLSLSLVNAHVRIGRKP